MLSAQESEAIEANLFPSARWLVHERPNFPWHRDRTGHITASVPFSSQALALDFFGTVDHLQSRDVVLGRIAHNLGLSSPGPWYVTPEEGVPRDLLGEPRRTQIDAVARGAAGIILFECKFTELDGGSCSQPIPITYGANKGLRQCNGNYQEQVNPISGLTSRCPLTAKGVKYWALIPQVLRVDPGIDHLPCPFVGGWYQWMRNLVAAAAMSASAGVPAVFVVVYADGPFPMAQKVRSEDWRRFANLVTGPIQLRAISYQALLAWARDAGSSDGDRAVLDDCATWIQRKVTAAATSLARSATR